MKQGSLFSAIALFLLPGVVCAADIYVIDGDSIRIDDREIRLSGIDAPEYFQTCRDKNNRDYDCGQQAREFLASLVGPDLHCEKIVTDKYKREVSVCKSGGINLNEAMVRNGWAVAYQRYTHDYDTAQKEAKERRLGIWQGKFLKPEFYRILSHE